MSILNSSSLWSVWRGIKAILTSNIVLSAVLGAGITAITLNLDFHRIEAFFYDLRVRLAKSQDLDPRIQLVSINDEDQGGYSYLYLNSINTHLVALEKMIAAKPAAIVYLNRFEHSDVEYNLEAAEKFVSIAQNAAKEGIKVYFGTDVDLSGEILPPYPLSLLPHYPAVIHKDGTVFGEDKVTRRALLTILNQPALHLRLAYPDLADEVLTQNAPNQRGAYYFSQGDLWHILVRYPQNTSISNKKFHTLPYSKIVSNRMPLEDMGNKIMIVDSLRKDSINDFAITPFSRNVYTHPRLYIHAAILDTILKDNGLITIPHWFDIGLTLFLCVLLTYITLRYSPSRGVVSVLVAGCILFLGSVLLFQFGGAWLRLVHPLFAMFFAYYLIVPYRAILEYKMRWEVQQKHDLLVEVEEMKGNFLSLMSHDLKTPVARIQGLSEMVLRKGNLSAEQERELKEILYSTENLDKFISKILNLTKVESSQIKLNRRSKDINKIIETCSNKLAFQAQQKNIQMRLKLEPLFPIQIDAALIIQVLTNLIDNAIKYSTAGSTIVISSRELVDKNSVEIKVADSGQGLAPEEMQRLFTKFFRGRATVGEQLKGSGLGLYLTKYFIELHSGTIQAESIKGKGSIFTITLPVQAAHEDLNENEGVAYV